MGFSLRLDQPWSSAATSEVIWLALPSTVAPAWSWVWSLVKLAISDAKSVSRMIDSAAVVFSSAARRLLALDSSVFA